MKAYTSPKADFIEIGNTDILTASFGINLPSVDFVTSNVAANSDTTFSTMNSTNADNGADGKESMYLDK